MCTYATPSMIRRWTVVCGLWTVFLSASLVLPGCGKKKAAEGKEVIPIRAMRVEARTIARSLDYADSIEAQDKAEIFPKVNGKIIEKLKEDGSPVTKGETIAYIDRDEVGFKFEKAPIESPLTGIIGRVYVDKGTSVTPQTAVAMVVDIDRVKVHLNVPEKYIPQLALGQKARVRVDAYPGEIFTGVVARISPVVETETRTAPVEIGIDNAGHRLKPGMFASISLVLEEKKDVPVIMKEAIVGREPSAYVFVVNGGTAHSRDVKLGIRDGEWYEVREGLKAGDLVAIMGQQRLRDGAPVNVEVDKSSR